MTDPETLARRRWKEAAAVLDNRDRVGRLFHEAATRATWLRKRLPRRNMRPARRGLGRSWRGKHSLRAMRRRGCETSWPPSRTSSPFSAWPSTWSAASCGLSVATTRPSGIRSRTASWNEPAGSWKEEGGPQEPADIGGRGGPARLDRRHPTGVSQPGGSNPKGPWRATCVRRPPATAGPSPGRSPQTASTASHEAGRGDMAKNPARPQLPIKQGLSSPPRNR
jgi:hypothetical protein